MQQGLEGGCTRSAPVAQVSVKGRHVSEVPLSEGLGHLQLHAGTGLDAPAPLEEVDVAPDHRRVALLHVQEPGAIGDARGDANQMPADQSTGAGLDLPLLGQHPPQLDRGFGVGEGVVDEQRASCRRHRPDQVIGAQIGDRVGGRPDPEREAVRLRGRVRVVDPPEGEEDGRVRGPEHGEVVQLDQRHPVLPAAEPARPQEPRPDVAGRAGDAELLQPHRAGIGVQSHRAGGLTACSRG